MRSYPRNSPAAAARVVALVLISDGQVSSSEFESLNQLDGVRDLGLEPNDMPGTVQTLCEDLLMEGFDGRSILSHVGGSLLVSLIAEVDEPQLRRQVLRLAASAAHSDKHLSEGEAAMLDAISRIWQTSPFTAGVVGAQIHRRELAHADSS
jgi:hypothetical protein